MLKRFVEDTWDNEIVPVLSEYIRIPNKSPAFDPEWAAHGHMDKAVGLFAAWARKKLDGIAGASLEVWRLANRTPLIFVEIPGQVDDTVILYGHLDKQPEMNGWAEGTSPWVPILKDDKLFGRGGADDGYAMFGSLSAILALREQGIPTARCVIIIEACEESGSYDLPHYIDHFAARIGMPSLVICLDSSCGNYDQLWLTTSLRGVIKGVLRVDVLSEGVHSGAASGIVPSSFRILRELLTRLEDPSTGAIKVEELFVDIPVDRIAQATVAAQALGDEIWSKFPFVEGMRPAVGDSSELILNSSWRPQLAVIGADGLPPSEAAGNVLRPFTSLNLSIRIPPLVDPQVAGSAVKALFEFDPPYGAKVTCDFPDFASGWNSPALAPWLERSLGEASHIAFGRPPALMGEGGSIPFMAMLGRKFPEAQFVITGVLGPHSNAHGPNEFLHIPTGKAVTVVVAKVLEDHAKPR